MSCPTFDILEAHARGELDPPEKSSLRAHLAGCAACAREAAALAAEQRLFAGRADHLAPELAGALPSFDALLARARAESVPDRRSRRAAWASFGLAAAAAILGLLYALRSPEPSPAASAAEDIGPDLACFDGEPALEDEPHLLDNAIASVEDEYSACLVATPLFNDGRERCTMSCSVDVGP